MTYSRGGTSYSTDRTGRLSSISKTGMEAHYGSSGTLRSAHFDRPGGTQLNVSHGMRGERRIETVRADRTRVVSWAPHAGFVERPFGRGYVSRTYFAGGQTYVHVYRTYSFRGATYYGYVPRVYYGPKFYGWVWNPWSAPVAFGWGWRTSPWFDYYGGYFAPAPTYASAALWLADYVLAESLALAWENHQAAMSQQAPQPDAPQPDAPPPADSSQGGAILTPEIKQAVADEVKQQIAAEYAAANQPASQPVASMAEQAPSALDPNQKIFVVSSSLTVNSGTLECSLTPGDIIVRKSYMSISAHNTVPISVLSSKPGDCAVNTAAEIDLVTLQEMHNQFRAQVDNGLKMLAEQQGQDGLPAAPPAEARGVANLNAEADSPESVETAISEQQQEANEAMQEVRVTAAAR